MMHLRSCVAKDFAQYPTASVFLKQRKQIENLQKQKQQGKGKGLGKELKSRNDNDDNYEFEKLSSLCQIHSHYGFPTDQLLLNNQEQTVINHQQLPSVLTPTGSSTNTCLLYTSPSPRDQRGSRMPSSA